MTMVHDFGLAGNYLVFCVPPLRVNPLPLLLNLKGFSEAVEWQPQLGTTILVVDRERLELVSQTVTEPWYQWHFGNGYADRDGNLVLDLVRYKDFATNQFLKEVATGSVQQVVAGNLYQMRLNPLTGELLGSERLSDRMVEFPSVPAGQVNQAARYTYLSVGEVDLVGTIGRYDHETGAITVAAIPSHCYAMEPIFVADRNRGIDQGWVLTVVFDSQRDCSEVWIFDSEQMAESPIARLALPEIVPLGFHGTWHDRSR
jgi:all-trans-8'-apo-beta-carotenal 15,15'-oxygenase